MKLLSARWISITILCCLLGCASKPSLDIYWIDTEGGAATLIVTPQRESVLIDSGYPGGRDAKRIHEVAAKVAGLVKINHLITTHYHRDHMGGASELAKLMPIDHLYDNGDFHAEKDRPSPEYLQFRGDRGKTLSPGDVVPLKGNDLKLLCVAARQEVIQPPANARLARNPLCENATTLPEDRTDNANSIAVVLSYGDFQFFDGGDLTWNIEAKLVCPFNVIGEVDVMQADHHGLDVSNNPALVQSLAPTVIVFNNGPTKGCGPKSFATAKSTPSVKAIYQMHRNLRPNEAHVNAPADFIANDEREADCKGNYIKLSVDLWKKCYTVYVPSRQHAKAYKIR